MYDMKNDEQKHNGTGITRYQTKRFKKATGAKEGPPSIRL